MPALPDLLDFEHHWDQALAAVLATIGGGLAVHVGRGTNLLEPPYVAGFFTFLGEVPAGTTSQPQVRGGNGPTQFDPVSFRGRFNIFLATRRQTTTAAALQHWRGSVRRLFLPGEILRAFNGVVLPYYDLRTITWSAGERTIDEDRDLDETALMFEFDWAIRREAWPT